MSKSQAFFGFRVLPFRTVIPIYSEISPEIFARCRYRSGCKTVRPSKKIRTQSFEVQRFFKTTDTVKKYLRFFRKHLRILLSMSAIFSPFLLNIPATPGAPGASSFLMVLLFALAFWFLMVAPQRKRQKQQEKMIAALKEGDEILTTSGLFATVLQVKSDRLLIKTGDSKLELHKSFVQSKITEPKIKTASKSDKK